MADGVRQTRVAILVASDRGAAGERVDTSGEIIGSRCAAAGHMVVTREISPDDRDAIGALLAAWCDQGIADIILTSGGTGLSPRDVTPEATKAVAERDVPGIPLLLANEGLKKTPFAILSRGVAVTRGNTLIVNLPGNPKAVDEGMDVLLPLFGHITALLTEPVEHVTDADSGHGLAGRGNGLERR